MGLILIVVAIGGQIAITFSPSYVVGGVTCKSQSKIGFRLHVLVVYRWKNEWRGEKYIEQGGLLQRIWKCGQCVLPEYQCLLCRCISVVDEI